MKERLKIIRKSFSQKVSQEKFGEMLGVSRNAIKTYELGAVIPSDTFIQLLCTKFNINENWLRTGNGSMHIESTDSIFQDFAQRYSLSPAERDVARYCLELTSEQRAEILKHIVNIAAIIKSSEQPKIEPTNQTIQLLAAEDPAPYNSKKTVTPAKRKMSTEMKQAIVNSELSAEKREQMS